MNAATHAKPRVQAHKRPPLSDATVLASLKQIVFSDDLRHRWERIVQGEHA